MSAPLPGGTRLLHRLTATSCHLRSMATVRYTAAGVHSASIAVFFCPPTLAGLPESVPGRQTARTRCVENRTTAGSWQFGPKHHGVPKTEPG